MRVRDAITGSTDGLIASVASKYGMGGGLATSVYGWLSSGTTAVFIGVLVTIGGFVINLIFQRRRENREILATDARLRREEAEERRKQEMHEAQMEAIRHGHHK
ncbi:holin class II [Stenotrophomonas phage C121]|uniref:holin n=1 Tax=Stenotrophomonas phage C121 TaxID=2914029 RepID=UPI0023293915|nr:holin [Stenotrophomonas phage C121]UKL14819.1 holin class II [Stenotrophomonas phage C121]